MSIEKTYKPYQKRLILARWVECRVNHGYNISDIFATPLNNFNYEIILKQIKGFEDLEDVEGDMRFEVPTK